ncbi:M48 family metalloprotease [Sphingomicrobium astaxanthinifaciens]|uniref:M48 family metalloprotease n=1 Tax=Sphingomicrobium astaxanthinifaciens TaxID=1227949 RepID=UPI001FCBEDAD|nr:M48 family metalloprotease [Sphingomicrobium astaxanthinifaciens]MCJ7420624.1 M48 family metalloprotease [Sphingomicrobium astaxanthinifaciens]
MRLFATILTSASSLALASCATPIADPAISPQEAQIAERQHDAVVAEFGGALGGSLGAYVEQVGDTVAVRSATPNAAAAYRFTTLNAPVENAFAVPGGRIYVTRELLGLMEDEAELAFVLGHEVGHIAADHSQARQARAQRNSVLGVLGAIAGSVIGGDSGLGNLLAQGAQQYATLNTLSYSREQEYESDTLGIGYMSAAGYDPLAAASMLNSLGRASALEARLQGNDTRSTPEWARTHPLSENRTARAIELARQTGRAGSGIRDRDEFLSRIEGIMVDDDPAQGIVDGRTFTHPDLRLQFRIPTGFRMQNGTRAVSIMGQSGQAQFSLAPFNGNLDTYIAGVIRGIVGQQAPVSIPQPRTTTVNGIPAAYTTTRVNSGNGAVDLSVMAYRWDADTAYHFAMLTPAGQGIGPFSGMVGSLRPISAQEAAAIRPRVIDIVTVQRGDTPQSLARRMAYNNYQLERFLVLNSMDSGSTLTPGQKVKLVVYGRR